MQTLQAINIEIMENNEATARLKINKLLEKSDWRLVDNKHAKANVHVESHIVNSEIREETANYNNETG